MYQEMENLLFLNKLGTNFRIDPPFKIIYVGRPDFQKQTQEFKSDNKKQRIRQKETIQIQQIDKLIRKEKVKARKEKVRNKKLSQHFDNEIEELRLSLQQILFLQNDRYLNSKIYKIQQFKVSLINLQKLKYLSIRNHYFKCQKSQNKRLRTKVDEILVSQTQIIAQVQNYIMQQYDSVANQGMFGPLSQSTNCYVQSLISKCSDPDEKQKFEANESQETVCNSDNKYQQTESQSRTNTINNSQHYQQIRNPQQQLRSSQQQIRNSQQQVRNREYYEIERDGFAVDEYLNL